MLAEQIRVLPDSEIERAVRALSVDGMAPRDIAVLLGVHERVVRLALADAPTGVGNCQRIARAA